MGLKVFDGEDLEKRLQITFESEGHFNHFAHKIRKWLGLSVILLKPIVEQLLQQNSEQLDFFQPQPLSQRLQIENSQINSLSQDCSLSFMRAPEPLTYPVMPATIPQYQDPFLVLLEAAQLRRDDDSLLELSQQFSQPNTSVMSQSTQIWNEIPATNFSFNQVAKDNRPVELILKTTSQSNKCPPFDFAKALTDIPFSQKWKQPVRARTLPKKPKTDKMEIYLKRAVEAIIKDGQESYQELDDKELALRIARRLKSKSFFLFVKRVENLLHPMNEED